MITTRFLAASAGSILALGIAHLIDTFCPEYADTVLFASPGALWDAGRSKANRSGVANLASC